MGMEAEKPWLEDQIPLETHLFLASRVHLRAVSESSKLPTHDCGGCRSRRHDGTSYERLTSTTYGAHRFSKHLTSSITAFPCQTRTPRTEEAMQEAQRTLFSVTSSPCRRRNSSSTATTTIDACFHLKGLSSASQGRCPYVVRPRRRSSACFECSKQLDVGPGLLDLGPLREERRPKVAERQPVHRSGHSADDRSRLADSKVSGSKVELSASRW